MKGWEIRIWSNNGEDETKIPFGYHKGDDELVSRVGLGPVAIGWETKDE